MKRIYIDFDGTLFDTTKFRKISKEIISQEICKWKKDILLSDVADEIQEELKTKRFNSFFDMCNFFEGRHNLKQDCIKVKIEKFMENTENLLYPDSILFLENLKKLGYEVNILTYTSKNSFDYQMKKLAGSKITRLVDNIIICTGNKGDLGLDYANAMFVDDSPKALKSLHNAGVSSGRLIRMKRVGAGYSDEAVYIDGLVEVSNFKEIKNLQRGVV